MQAWLTQQKTLKHMNDDKLFAAGFIYLAQVSTHPDQLN